MQCDFVFAYLRLSRDDKEKMDGEEKKQEQTKSAEQESERKA